MKERPILYSGPMVPPVLAGTKTQTRRVVKPQPPAVVSSVYRPFAHEPNNWQGYADRDGLIHWYGKCPYGQPGDRLWVRESHWWFKDEHDPVTGYSPPPLTIEDVEYRADGEKPGRSWRPSIHMPRWASRITLEVTGVRVERLQDISEADAMAEGAEPRQPATASGIYIPGQYRLGFRDLWESINGPGSWDANPFVWVVSFRRI